MCGSHIFNSELFTVNEEVIEDGFNTVRCRPHEGMRLLYCPKHNPDLEFQPSEIRVVNGGGGAQGTAFSASSYHGFSEASGNSPLTLEV